MYKIDAEEFGVGLAVVLGKIAERNSRREPKRYRLSDGHYRIRRGRFVRIPDEWVGRVAHPQTQRKRRVAAAEKRAERRRRLRRDEQWDLRNWAEV